MIDWDNWWFFNNDKIKFGGLTEWSQYNLKKDKWYQDDLHHIPEVNPVFYLLCIGQLDQGLQRQK